MFSSGVARSGQAVGNFFLLPFLTHLHNGPLRLRYDVDHGHVLRRDEDAAGHVEGLDDFRRPDVVEYQQRAREAETGMAKVVEILEKTFTR